MPTHFVVVAGPPCAGKSTVARQVAAQLGAPHLEMDQFRRRLLPTSDQPVEHRDICYRAMHLAAELLAPRCEIIVLDATYTAAICRGELLRIVERVEGLLSVIECRVTPAVAEGRFLKRGAHPARDLTPERVTALARSYPYDPASCNVAGVATGHDLARLVRDALDKPLHHTNRLMWCSKGLPREASRAAPVRAVTEQQHAAASGHESR